MNKDLNIYWNSVSCLGHCRVSGVSISMEMIWMYLGDSLSHADYSLIFNEIC